MFLQRMDTDTDYWQDISNAQQRDTHMFMLWIIMQGSYGRQNYAGLIWETELCRAHMGDRIMQGSYGRQN